MTKPDVLDLFNECLTVIEHTKDDKAAEQMLLIAFRLCIWRMKYLRNVRRLKSLIGGAAGLEPPGRWQAFGTDISDRVLRQDRLPVRMASERRYRERAPAR